MLRLLKDWWDRRRVLRELRANEASGSEAYSAFFTEQIELALMELSHQRRQRALEIWRRMYSQYPDLCLKSERALNLFVDLCLHDEAEVLIEEGRRRFPRGRSLYDTALARVAYRRGDFKEALRRYEVVRRGFPQVVDSYTLAAVCLSALGSADEAEAMLERGMRKHADNYDLCARYAQTAVERRDWNAALERWKIVSRRFPYLPGPLGVAQCLRELGRLDEAENVLVDASERFASNPYPFAELAGLAIARGDLPEAIERWNVVLDRFPSFDRAYTESATIMRKVGRHAEADERLRVIVERSPEYLPGHVEYAKSAELRGDWRLASERWAETLTRFPECAEAIAGKAAALAAISRLQQ